MRTHVSFCADYDSANVDQSLPGGRLADFLAAEFSSRGVYIEKRQTAEHSYVFHTLSGGRRFGVLLGSIDDELREWLIMSFGKLGRIYRFFGAKDEDEHRALLHAIHEVLLADERFTDIRWYSHEEWLESPDESWADAPDGFQLADPEGNEE